MELEERARGDGIGLPWPRGWQQTRGTCRLLEQYEMLECWWRSCGELSGDDDLVPR